MAAFGEADVVMNNLEHADRTVNRLATFHADVLAHIVVMTRHDPIETDRRIADSIGINTLRNGRMEYFCGC